MPWTPWKGWGLPPKPWHFRLIEPPRRSRNGPPRQRAGGLEVIIAAAGGAAHLAGVVAAHTVLPVLGVPMKAWSLDGLDSLLSTVQMPRGVPVGTLAIGKAGAVNAALLAAQILGNKHPEIREAFREDRRKKRFSRDGPPDLVLAILSGWTAPDPLPGAFLFAHPREVPTE